VNEHELQELAERYGIYPWQEAVARRFAVVVEGTEDNMMIITVSTLSDTLERIEVLNQGHPDDGQISQTDDLRRYRWRTADHTKMGHVQHRRHDGALKLAQLVFNDLHDDG
jgi:hypothetical protein